MQWKVLLKQLEYGIDVCRISETDVKILLISTENHMLIAYSVAFVHDLIQKCRICFTSKLVTDQFPRNVNTTARKSLKF